MPPANRYSRIIEAMFHAKYVRGQREVAFERDDITTFASRLNINLPKNLGDVIYSLRYRTKLPASILEAAPEGETWIIRPAGRSRYRLVLVADVPFIPNPNLAVTKIPVRWPPYLDNNKAKIRESSAGVSGKPSSDGKARGCSSKHLCGLTARNT